MDSLLELLPRGDRVMLTLRGLYERFGYESYRMGRFEPYEIYAENKHFLNGEGIITFTDAAGRLMALKPDVTLSIVKNVKAETVSQKLYYNENVFRIEGRGAQYREINQMGIEYIGADGGYAQAEVLSLAAQSLAVISGSYMLNVSHMGFISGLLSALGLEGESGERLLHLLRQKNSDGLCALADELGLGAARRGALLGVAGICGELETAVTQAGQFVLCSEMETALSELEELTKALRAAGSLKNVRLDFSVINDLDYYNGLVFQGYVREAARAVLAGGRYDNLLRRLGKPQSAAGFALYLSELDRAFHRVRDFDVDVLLIYGETAADTVAAEVARLTAGGESVRAEKQLPPDVRARRTVRLEVPNA